MRKHVAPRDVHFVCEGQRYRVASFSAILLLVSDEDRFHGRLLARSGDDDRLATRHAAAGNRPSEATEVEMRPVDPLHRQTERSAAAVFFDLDGFELLQEMPALVPRRFRAV